MPRLTRIIPFAVALAVLAIVASIETRGPGVPPRDVRLDRTTLTAPFVPNRGQTDPAVAFLASMGQGTLFVTHDGAMVHALVDGDGGVWSVVETFVDGLTLPVAGTRSPTTVSRFVGTEPSGWQTAMPSYEDVGLGHVWPGIDVRLRAHAGAVEKIFEVAPEADVGDIRVRLDGTADLRHGEAGTLRAAAGEGEIILSTPVAWQDGHTGRDPVAVAYSLHDQGYGFVLGAHDPSRPVFIDPLVGSTYLGGSANDRGLAVGRNPRNGSVYVTGTTWSVDFPGTTGGPQEEHAGAGANQDVFVARLSHDLSTLEQATYLGGSGPQIGLAGNEEATCITASLHEGYIYVAGFTSSSGLPGTDGSAQPTPAGGIDAFVVAFNEDLDDIIRTTFLGGGSEDIATGIDFFYAEDDVYVTGYTRSTSFWGVDSFSAQPAHGGGTWDGFVTRLGLTLAGGQSTFLGGNADDRANAICHDTTGMIHVAGETQSTDFPGAADGWWHTNRGYIDGFVSRMAPDLRTPIRTTYFGGQGEDRALGIAHEPIDEVIIICGVTTSDEDDLRYQRLRMLGAQYEHGGGVRDGFVAVYDRQLQTEPRVSYIGGRGNDIARGVYTAYSNRIFVVGETTSSDLPATEGGAQSEYAGATDAFVARFTSRVNALMQVTYLGGSGADMGYGLIKKTSNLYVTGITGSPDFPGTSGSAQPTHGGGAQDAFVAEFDRTLAAPTTPDPSFALMKAKVRLKSSGYKVELKKGYLVPGTGGYMGNGEDIRIFVDGTEVAPVGARTTKVKSSRITIKSTTDPKCKLTIKTSSWKVKLAVKRLAPASVDMTDGMTFEIHLLGLVGEVTGQPDSGGKKLVPVTGTVE